MHSHIAHTIFRLQHMPCSYHTVSRVAGDWIQPNKLCSGLGLRDSILLPSRQTQIKASPKQL